MKVHVVKTTNIRELSVNTNTRFLNKYELIYCLTMNVNLLNKLLYHILIHIRLYILYF